MHFIYALQARPLSVGDFPSYFNHLLHGETTLLRQLPSSAEKGNSRIKEIALPDYSSIIAVVIDFIVPQEP